MGTVTHQQHQRAAAHHLIKLVAVADHEPPTIGSGMHRLVSKLYAGDGLAAEPAQKIVVIAGHINHAGSTGRQIDEFVDNGLMGIGEMHPSLHCDQVNDVAHQVERFTAYVTQEIQQVFRLAVRRAQVYVGNENAPIAPHGVSRLSTSPDADTLARSGDGEMTTKRQFCDV